MLNCIDKALAERDNNLKKFCQSLDKDIAELGRELKEVKRDSQVTENNCFHNVVHSNDAISVAETLSGRFTSVKTPTLLE
jgi:hypothetical protein